MKNKGVFLAAILTAVLCLSGNVFAILSGGGTQVNPYLIQSRADFDEFANPANSATYWASGVYTKLTLNLDLSGTTYTQAVIAPDTSTSSGFQGTQFTGIFDGNGHTISNLTINQPTQDYVGLFGYVGSGGQISNLGVEDVNITGDIYVGGLVGLNSGTLISCYATGSVTGYGLDGGLVGKNSGTMTSCYATGSVTGTGGDFVGGLVGYNEYGPLTSCHATGPVTGTGSVSQFVGGLVGANNSGMLTGCYATGSVSGTYTYVGGLVGENFGLSSLTDCYATGPVSGIYWVGGLVGVNSSVLTKCYATGSVSGTQRVGGLVGYNGGIDGVLTSCYATGAVSGNWYVGGLVGWNDFGTLTSCYATGSVTGDWYVGGLVGANDGSITACYATGSVSGGTGEYFGGLVGSNYFGSITACFWDTETCLPATVGVGAGTSTGVTGKTTAEMKTLTTFTSAGWDFINVWAIAQNQTYPCLRTGLSADLNYDGVVDPFDLAIFADQWLEGI